MRVGTQAKPDFPGGLENVICMSTSPMSSSTFHLPHLKGEHLHFCINVFFQKTPSPSSNLVLHLTSGPWSSLAFLWVKPSIDYRVLKPSNWFQSAKSSWTEAGSLHVVLEKSFSDCRFKTWRLVQRSLLIFGCFMQTNETFQV